MGGLGKYYDYDKSYLQEQEDKRGWGGVGWGVYTAMETSPRIEIKATSYEMDGDEP